MDMEMIAYWNEMLKISREELKTMYDKLGADKPPLNEEEKFDLRLSILLAIRHMERLDEELSRETKSRWPNWLRLKK